MALSIILFSTCSSNYGLGEDMMKVEKIKLNVFFNGIIYSRVFSGMKQFNKD